MKISWKNPIPAKEALEILRKEEEEGKVKVLKEVDEKGVIHLKLSYPNGRLSFEEEDRHTFLMIKATPAIAKEEKKVKHEKFSEKLKRRAKI